MSQKVLLVDDSQVIRAAIKKVLRMTGMEIAAVLEAADGREALEVVKREQVDLILLDVNMPNVDGLETLRRLKDSAETREIPVVMVTSEGTQDLLDQAMELGAAGYVTKPFTPEVLTHKLQEIGVAAS